MLVGESHGLLTIETARGISYSKSWFVFGALQVKRYGFNL